MATSRTREVWRDRSTGDAYLVELEAERVLTAQGPVDPGQLTDLEATWTAAAAGRTPAFTGLATDLERRRGEFERQPLPGS